MDGVYIVLDAKRYIVHEKMSINGTDHFCYLLSRTERGDGYVAMLQSLKTAQQWLEIDDIYNVKATSSDHHDGLINAIRSELPDGSIH